MNIYFSCSITGGRQDQGIYKTIVDHLIKNGHVIPTAHLSSPDVMSLEQVVDPLDIFLRDVAWVKGCDALIAEVSTPSHGVGYEIALALENLKPVLCLYQHGRRVSKMITGNNMSGMTVHSYQTANQAIQYIQDFLAN
jgi:hypothetical protein